MSITRRLVFASFLSLSVSGLLNAALTAAEPEPKADKVIGLDGEKWTRMFDGKTLGKWEILDKFDFKEHGKVAAEAGSLVLSAGQPATGIRWPGDFPKMNYELALETKRVEGGDFFCALTFPVGDKALSLIMGGWGGWVVGISCLDGYYAADNETCTAIQFENDRWYHVRVQVTQPKITVWIDDKETITLEPEGRKLSVSWEMEPCQPLGVATWYTTGALRNIQYRTLEDKKPE